MIVSGQLKKIIAILNHYSELSEAALYLPYSLAQAALFCSLAILYDISKPDISIFFISTLQYNVAVIEINFLQWPSYLIYHSLKWSSTSGLGNLGSPCETKEWLTTKVSYQQIR